MKQRTGVAAALTLAAAAGLGLAGAVPGAGGFTERLGLVVQAGAQTETCTNSACSSFESCSYAPGAECFLAEKSCSDRWCRQ